MIKKQIKKTSSRKFILHGTSWWGWMFVILSIAIPIISFGGVSPSEVSNCSLVH